MKVRSRGVLSVILAVAFLAASGPHAAVPQTGGSQPLPAEGNDIEQSLARGESREFRMELTVAEFIQITIEAFAPAETDEWPVVTVTSPDGGTLHESNEPSIASSIDSWPRSVVSFTTERAGTYQLRIVARGSPVRYRLRLDRR